MKKTYPVEITSQSDPILFYPSDFGELKDIELINFGQHACLARVEKNPSTNESIVLTEGLAHALKFTETNTPLHVFVYKNSIHLGPLIGIFSSGFTKIPNKPLGERSEFFSKLLSLNTMTGCIPFIFGEQHIDWDYETIHGYVFLDSEWSVYEFPFPNVVYDRLPNRRTEKETGAKEVKQKFQELYTIPWYNPGFFNKWDMYERLTQDDTALAFLPETYPLNSLSTIEHLLSNYRHAFIKPIHGSLGLGIHQVIYDKQDHAYYCRYTNEEQQKKLQRFPSLEAMMNHVFRNRTLDNLIVQQGISLIRFEKHPVDFRVHSNKDSQGNWQVTAIAAKVAGSGSVTTHIKNGGSVKIVRELFEDDEKAKEIEQKLTTAAITLSQSIEKNLDGIIAEIGFDFGVDKQGQVWMFEANSKPGRSIFSHPKLKEFELLTRKLSLDYAIYLAEQSITQSMIGVSK